MVKLIVYALLAYIAFHFVRRFLLSLGGRPTDKPERPTESHQAESSRAPAQDLVRCGVCGSYVAARCARTNCPQ